MAETKTYEQIDLRNFRIDCVSRKDLVDLCLADIRAGVGRPKLVFDINGHGIALAESDETFREAVTKADITHADGGFLVSLSRILPGGEIPERSATTDVFHDFADAFVKTGNTFYLLGGTEEANRDCARIMEDMHPGLKIVGRRNGYFSEAEEQGVIDEINALKPDVLWVGLGKPKEQAFSIKWRDSLETSWIITCGGCYNYVTGDYPRAPQWMQDMNLEWLHRMATNPRQLGWRYISTNPLALWVALTGWGRSTRSGRAATQG